MNTNTDFSAIEKKSQRNERIRKIITYVLLTFWAVIVLFPFYWMILTSVKSYSAYNSEYVPQLYTLSPTMQNYFDAFTAVPLTRYFLNTLIFTVVTTLLMMVVTVLAAFAFARLKFPGKDILFTLFLSLMMIPNELVIITNFVTITNAGMRNSYIGLILPSVTSVFQGGRNLRLQISMESHDPDLPANHGDHCDPESHRVLELLRMAPTDHGRPGLLPGLKRYPGDPRERLRPREHPGYDGRCSGHLRAAYRAVSDLP